MGRHRFGLATSECSRLRRGILYAVDEFPLETPVVHGDRSGREKRPCRTQGPWAPLERMVSLLIFICGGGRSIQIGCTDGGNRAVVEAEGEILPGQGLRQRVGAALRKRGRHEDLAKDQEQRVSSPGVPVRRFHGRSRGHKPCVHRGCELVLQEALCPDRGEGFHSGSAPSARNHTIFRNSL